MRSRLSPLRPALTAVFATTLASGLAAQATPVPPFAGDRSEGFEAQPPIPNSELCVPTGVFGGAGTLCSSQLSSDILNAVNFVPSCQFLPFEGSRCYFSGFGTPRFTFDPPVARFGGRFGFAPESGGATALFYDAAGALIASSPLAFLADCTWQWSGWELAPGVAASAIEIVNTHPASTPGFTIPGLSTFDDLRIAYEPITLVGSPAQISVANGGTQTLDLAAGAANAGDVYLLLGSVTGTAPGFQIDGFTLPLNVDAYTLATLFAPNAPPLAGSLGTFDANGTAQATFTIAPGSASLAGLTASHAYVALDVQPTLVSIVLVSMAVDVALVP